VFRDCTSLTYVSLPALQNFANNQVFMNMPSFTLELGATPPSAGHGTFNSFSNTVTLRIPEGSYAAYQTFVQDEILAQNASVAYDFTTPGAPTGLTAMPGDGQVSLSWTTPASNGGSAITKYQLSYGATSGYSQSWQDIQGSGASTVGHTVTGLTNGTGYTFEIRAVNAAGTGASSGTVTATAYATLGQPYDGIDFNVLIGGGVYYGQYDHATTLYDGDEGSVTARDGTAYPILWSVRGAGPTSYNADGIGDNTNYGMQSWNSTQPSALALSSVYALDSRAFHTTSYDGVWETSAVRDFLQGMADGQFLHSDHFVTGETGGIAEVTNLETRNDWNRRPVYTNDTVYLLGWDAMRSSDTHGLVNDYGSEASDRIATLRNGTAVYWWLRAPDEYPSELHPQALVVYPGGNQVGKRVPSLEYGIRPAFKLNPASVIFASEIKSGADAAKGETEAGGNYSAAAGGGAQNFKLTVFEYSVNSGRGNCRWTRG
jgi:hypothetical protein